MILSISGILILQGVQQGKSHIAGPNSAQGHLINNHPWESMAIPQCTQIVREHSLKASLFIHHHCPLWHTILACPTPMKTNISPAKQKWLDNDFLFKNSPFLGELSSKNGGCISSRLVGNATSNPKAFSKTALLVAPSAGLPNQKKSTPVLVLTIIRDPFGGLVRPVVSESYSAVPAPCN